MSEENNGCAAFPQPLYERPDGLMAPRFFGPGSGISMRDYFAAYALQAVIALDSDADLAGCAHDAYLYAEAMLRERSK